MASVDIRIAASSVEAASSAASVASVASVAATSTALSSITKTNISSPSPSVQYTYGLTGVDVDLDNLSSQTMYATVGLTCLIITLVRLCQLYSAHMRHLSTMAAIRSEQQNYFKHERGDWWPWIKRNLVYAPLRNKRHNREIQLSGAFNMGTIPGRLHLLLLSLYLVSNIIYCALLDYGNQPSAALMAELRGRTGHLATLNMIALFVMAGRNNIFIRILRVSFDTFNLFHRWIGRIVVLESVVHTVAWAINKQKANGWRGISEAMGGDAFIQYGTLGTVALLVITIQACSPIRHAFYETFLHLHQLLAFLVMVGLVMHVKLGKLPQLPFVIFIICIWAYDRIARTTRVLYYNFSLARGMTRVTVEALPAEACRVTFHLPRRWNPRPGAHVFVYLPSISLWQSHPFSVAWSTSGVDHTWSAPTDKDSTRTGSSRTLTENTSHSLDLEKQDSLPRAADSAANNTSSVSLIMAARTGMTRSLHARAAAAPNGRLCLRGALEGPYGALESLHSYGTVVLFAGGVGITHNMPHLRDLLARHAEREIPLRRLTLVWTVRSLDQLEWVRPWMDTLLNMPGRREVLKILVFVTKPRNPREVNSASERVQMFAGRPKPAVLLRAEFEHRVGAMCVGVCGPGALADDVRAGAREIMARGKVDFWEEGFTW